jgi:uncharacterized membrane protein HdeD (DUF308 family)
MADPYSSETMTSFAVIDPAHIHARRGWFVGLGAVLVALGLCSIFLPFLGSLVTTFVIGWLLMVAGVAEGIHAYQNRAWGHWGWEALAGVLSLVAGFLLVAFPLRGTVALTLILAAWFTAEGLIKIIRAVQHRGMPAWGFLLFDGILALVLGLLILVRWPSTAVWAIGLLVGVDLLFGGMSLLLIGMRAGAMNRAHV